MFKRQILMFWSLLLIITTSVILNTSYAIPTKPLLGPKVLDTLAQEKTSPTTNEPLLKTMYCSETPLKNKKPLTITENCYWYLEKLTPSQISELSQSQSIKAIRSPNIYKPLTDKGLVFMYANITYTPLNGFEYPAHTLTYDNYYINTSRVTIAIIDTGINPNHYRFLDANITYAALAYFNDTSNSCEYSTQLSDYYDYDGHGTHVAYIAHSTAPPSPLIILKAGNSSFREEDILCAIDKAVELNASIISMSLGGGFYYTNDCSFGDALCEKVNYVSKTKNITFTIAAGNEATSRQNYNFSAQANIPLNITFYSTEQDATLKTILLIKFFNLATPYLNITIYNNSNGNYLAKLYYDGTNYQLDNPTGWYAEIDPTAHYPIISTNNGVYLILSTLNDNITLEIISPDDDFIEIYAHTGILDPYSIYHTVASPGIAEEAITVGSIISRDNGLSYLLEGNISDFSSRGPVRISLLNEIIKPDILAAGQIIYAAWAESNYNLIGYSGTSMATPFIAGAVAMIKSITNNMSSYDVKQLLCMSATDAYELPNFSPAAKGCGLINFTQLYYNLPKIIPNQTEVWENYSVVFDTAVPESFALINVTAYGAINSKILYPVNTILAPNESIEINITYESFNITNTSAGNEILSQNQIIDGGFAGAPKIIKRKINLTKYSNITFYSTPTVFTYNYPHLNNYSLLILTIITNNASYMSYEAKIYDTLNTTYSLPKMEPHQYEAITIGFLLNIALENNCKITYYNLTAPYNIPSPNLTVDLEPHIQQPLYSHTLPSTNITVFDTINYTLDIYHINNITNISVVINNNSKEISFYNTTTTYKCSYEHYITSLNTKFSFETLDLGENNITINITFSDNTSFLINLTPINISAPQLLLSEEYNNTYSTTLGVNSSYVLNISIINNTLYNLTAIVEIANKTLNITFINQTSVIINSSYVNESGEYNLSIVLTYLNKTLSQINKTLYFDLESPYLTYLPQNATHYNKILLNFTFANDTYKISIGNSTYTNLTYLFLTQPCNDTSNYTLINITLEDWASNKNHILLNQTCYYTQPLDIPIIGAISTNYSLPNITNYQEIEEIIDLTDKQIIEKNISLIIDPNNTQTILEFAIPITSEQILESIMLYKPSITLNLTHYAQNNGTHITFTLDLTEDPFLEVIIKEIKEIIAPSTSSSTTSSSSGGGGGYYILPQTETQPPTYEISDNTIIFYGEGSLNLSYNTEPLTLYFNTSFNESTNITINITHTPTEMFDIWIIELYKNSTSLNANISAILNNNYLSYDIFYKNKTSPYQPYKQNQTLKLNKTLVFKISKLVKTYIPSTAEEKENTTQTTTNNKTLTQQKEEQTNTSKRYIIAATLIIGTLLIIIASIKFSKQIKSFLIKLKI